MFASVPPELVVTGVVELDELDELGFVECDDELDELGVVECDDELDELGVVECDDELDELGFVVMDGLDETDELDELGIVEPDELGGYGSAADARCIPSVRNMAVAKSIRTIPT